MNKLSALIAVTTLTLAGSAIALADDAAASNTAVVRYSDLDLNNTRGASALYQRIRSAAYHVCRNLEGRSLESQEGYATCVHQAIEKAIVDVDRTSVTAYAVVRSVSR
jgi:UrcA family protein